jgi:hypothetical protein
MYPITTLNVADANTLGFVFDDDDVPHRVLQVLSVLAVKVQPWKHANGFQIG